MVLLGNKVYQKRIYTWRGLNKEMCSCEQDRMNIKLNNSAMGGSSSPKLSDSSSPGIWDTFGDLFGCREVAIVDRLNCRGKKPL